MKFGINNWVYDDEDLETTFARLSKFGYDAVELMGELGRYDIDEVKRLCAKYEIKISSILAWCIWGIPGRDLSSPDPEERQAAIEYGSEVVRFAAEVGAPIVLVLPFPANRTYPVGNPTALADWQSAAKLEWDNAVDSVRKAAEFARQYGITLAVEPINRYETYQLITVDDALRFVSEVGMENVKINLDAFHMNIDESDLPEAIRKAGDLLVHFHCADSNREAPGRGHTDFTAVVAALQEVGFTGTIVFEPVPPGGDPGITTRLPENFPLRDIYAQESINLFKRIESELSAG